MATTFNEDNTIEQMIISTLKNNGWKYIPAEELPRMHSDMLVEPMVKEALIRLNPEIAEDPSRADEVIYKLRTVILSVQPHNLVTQNEVFKKMIFEENSYPFGKDGRMVPIRFFGTMRKEDLEEYGDDAAEFDEDEIHTFIVPKGYHWNDVRAVSENVGVAIVEAFRKVENANSDKLQGIFGDGAWTNKNRLPDRLLKDLLEHFSTKTLSIANCPEDELGQGYEYLIKKFADDSGHTAQEFYTNRTVVHLMTEMLKPESGESIYDPTCGSAGMLISAIAYLKEQGKEWRNVAVYGQEINALTSAIGKMNLFLHGVKDFSIVNGDTLASPAFIENGKLQQFDLCLANPPYSISQWDRAAFESDKYGRNFLGVPPQGRADYAFLQHIIASLKEDTGRCAILFPHGVLFRNEESTMREKLVRSDRVECVINSMSLPSSYGLWTPRKSPIRS